MATILWNKGEQSAIDTWLAGSTDATVVSGSVFGVGLGAQTGGVGSDKSKGNGVLIGSTIAEIGQTTPNGYSRQPINRNNAGAGGWPLSTMVTTSRQVTGPQVTFTFSGSPNLNGATLWFVGLTTTIGANDCLFGGDTAVVRTFGTGDSEKITPTFRDT